MAVGYSSVLFEVDLRLSGYISLEVNHILSISTDYNIFESMKEDSLFLCCIYIHIYTITCYDQ